MRFPRFRKRSRRMGVRFTTGAIRCESDRHHVTLPRLRRIKTHESTRKLARRIEAGTARILAATVSCDAAGRWHVAFTVQVQRHTGCAARPAHARRLAPAGAAVGVDVGVADLLVAATAEGGEVLRVAAPRALGNAQTRLVGLQRKQARQQPGSNRGRRTKRRVGRVHARAANVRRDALAEVRRQLAYKTVWYGSALVVADRWYPSSKTCSGCGSRKPRLALSERTYQCESCGLAVDRDHNAAVNLARLSAMRPAGSGPVAGRGAERETEAAPAADAAGCEASTPHRPEPGKTGTAPPQGEAA